MTPLVIVSLLNFWTVTRALCVARTEEVINEIVIGRVKRLISGTCLRWEDNIKVGMSKLFTIRNL